MSQVLLVDDVELGEMPRGEGTFAYDHVINQRYKDVGNRVPSNSCAAQLMPHPHSLMKSYILTRSWKLWVIRWF